MAGYLIDTNVLIDHLRGDTGATEAIQKLYMTAEPVLTSVICLAEIYANTRAKEKPAVDELFQYIKPAPIDPDTAIRAGEYLARHRGSHAVDLPDALIAASAFAASATLVTNNTKHFPMKDIKVTKPGNSLTNH